MHHFKALLLLFFLPVGAPAQPTTAHALPEGTLLKTALPAAPFPAVSRSGGHVYDGQHYSRSVHYANSTVALFIPQGFRRSDSVDYIVHFHGWWNTVDSTLQAFELAAQLQAAGKNAILVVPQGPVLAPDSNGGKLEGRGGFERFMEQVSRVVARHLHLRAAPPRHIVLSAHSGGYRVVSYILLHGGLRGAIKEVWLFDGLYGQLEKYAMWLERGGARFVNLYTPSGGTKAISLDFRRSLQAWGLEPVQLRSEAGQLLPELPQQGAVFWSTGLGHNEVLHRRRQFEHLVRSSRWVDDK